jgi:hypothetical protein
MGSQQTLHGTEGAILFTLATGERTSRGSVEYEYE